jgi:hypothetical protein
MFDQKRMFIRGRFFNSLSVESQAPLVFIDNRHYFATNQPDRDNP